MENELDCPDNCDVCSDASTCTTCSDSYYLYNGECVGSCSPGSYKAGNSCLGKVDFLK